MPAGDANFRWAAKARATVAACLAGAVAGTGLYLGNQAIIPAAGCPRACATGGLYVFDPQSLQMTQVELTIAMENARVTSNGRPYVTVAVLEPFTYSPAGDVTLAQMVDEMRGAYLAQAQINRSGIQVIPGRPGVRLLLVNEGTSGEELEAPAVQQIEALEKPDHIVAVVGMGLSTHATERAAAALAKDGMPMFAALTTSDQFNSHNYAGYHLVTPNVKAQVEAMSTTLPTAKSAILVLDSQARADYYTMQLRNDFEEVFSQSLHLHLHLHPYTPHAVEASVQLEAIAEGVCHAKGQPPVVFYAGRSAGLTPLIRQFQQASDCAGTKITILSGADTAGLDPAVTKSPPDAPGGQVNVEYTDLVNINRLTPQYVEAYQQLLAIIDKSQTGLRDPWAIAPYDAMMAAWSAIAFGEASPGSLPTKEEVEGMTGQLNGMFAPIGATGTLELSAYGLLLTPDIPVYEDTNGTRRLIKS
jgi:ABC-type branched-subunit amino acid transport system substrate-binding protein